MPRLAWYKSELCKTRAIQVAHEHRTIPSTPADMKFLTVILAAVLISQTGALPAPEPSAALKLEALSAAVLPTADAVDAVASAAVIEARSAAARLSAAVALSAAARPTAAAVDAVASAAVIEARSAAARPSAAVALSAASRPTAPAVDAVASAAVIEGHSAAALPSAAVALSAAATASQAVEVRDAVEVCTSNCSPQNQSTDDYHSTHIGPCR